MENKSLLSSDEESFYFNRSRTSFAALARVTLLAGSLGWGSAAMAAGSGDAPVRGGTSVYLEQQAHTNLYPRAGASTRMGIVAR